MLCVECNYMLSKDFHFKSMFCFCSAIKYKKATLHEHISSIKRVNASMHLRSSFYTFYFICGGVFILRGSTGLRLAYITLQSF